MQGSHPRYSTDCLLNCELYPHIGYIDSALLQKLIPCRDAFLHFLLFHALHDGQREREGFPGACNSNKEGKLRVNKRQSVGRKARQRTCLADDQARSGGCAVKQGGQR